jgi:hypothetical protein
MKKLLDARNALHELLPGSNLYSRENDLAASLPHIHSHSLIELESLPRLIRIKMQLRAI